MNDRYESKRPVGKKKKAPYKTSECQAIIPWAQLEKSEIDHPQEDFLTVHDN